MVNLCFATIYDWLGEVLFFCVSRWTPFVDMLRAFPLFVRNPVELDSVCEFKELQWQKWSGAWRGGLNCAESSLVSLDMELNRA